jgi:hypothetical protein
VIEIPCVAKCSRCEARAPMTIEISGDFEVGNKKTLDVDYVHLPEGWHSYLTFYDNVKEIHCPKCNDEATKPGRR